MKIQSVLCAAALSLSVVAFAHGGDWSNMTKDQRNKMADANEQFAACLRTDKAVKECKSSFMDACKKSGLECGMHHEHHNAMKSNPSKASKSSSTESSGSNSQSMEKSSDKPMDKSSDQQK